MAGLLALCAIAPGCGQGSPTPAREEAARPTPAPAPPELTLVKRSRPMMGTIFEITVVGVDEATAAPAIERALDEIARLEDVLSEWRDDSEISRINASAGRRPVEVGEDTLQVVEAGMEVARWSDGAFDLSWAAMRDLYDFRPGQERVPDPREARRRAQMIRFRDVVVDPANRTVQLRRSGMSIGTGGIAKGYALDRAGQVLREAGIEHYMLFGGGQVQVLGRKGDRPWRVGIQHPRRADYFGFLEAEDGSISTSGDYEHVFIDAAGRRWHHILDPETGLPVEATYSVTILAADGLHADALSTACFVKGPEAALAMLAAIDYRADAVIVDPDLRVHMTPGARERLRLTMELTDGRLPP